MGFTLAPSTVYPGNCIQTAAEFTANPPPPFKKQTDKQIQRQLFSFTTNNIQLFWISLSGVLTLLGLLQFCN